jgi:vitamin B12 transporter
LQLRAFYKDVFRMPTFNEQYFFAIVQTRNIKPEDARQFDAGLTYGKGFDGIFNYIGLTADGYFNRVTNKIITLPNQNLAISSVLNLGRVDITGADAAIKALFQLNARWKAVFNGSYTYQHALDVTHSGTAPQIPYTPQNSFAVNAGVYNKHWGFYYNQMYSSSRYYIDDNSPEYNIAGFAVSDVTAVYNFLIKNKPLNLSGGINNVFNTSYAIVRSFPMPGRSVKLSMQITI